MPNVVFGIAVLGRSVVGCEVNLSIPISYAKAADARLAVNSRAGRYGETLKSRAALRRAGWLNATVLKKVAYCSGVIH